MVTLVAMLKIYFEHFYPELNQKANWLETSLEVLRGLVDQKLPKSLWLEIQDGCHLENLYWSSSQLTQNLSGNQAGDRVSFGAN